MVLFAYTECVQELGERNGVCLSGFADSLSLCHRTPEASHPESEEYVRGFRFFPDDIHYRTVCAYNHGITICRHFYLNIQVTGSEEAIPFF